MENIVLYYALKYYGDWERIFDAIEMQEDINFDELENILEEYKGKYITVYDPRYPKELRTTARPPFVLWYKGNVDLLSNKDRLWIYGTYYDKDTELVLEEQLVDLNKEFTLVSGYSSEFEKRLINNNPPKGMIIVRGEGIESNIGMKPIEEQMLMKDNVIISEYPGKVLPSLYNWEMSNRIKSGLTKKLYLINTEKEPTTFKLISDTIDDRRDIYCYAKDVNEKSHNTNLISKGAYGIINIKELKN